MSYDIPRVRINEQSNRIRLDCGTNTSRLFSLLCDHYRYADQVAQLSPSAHRTSVEQLADSYWRDAEAELSKEMTAVDAATLGRALLMAAGRLAPETVEPSPEPELRDQIQRHIETSRGHL